MIRRLLSDSLVYTVPTILTRGIGLLLLPIYARYLAPAEYGTIEVLALVYILMNLVIPLEVSQAVARFSADARSTTERDAYVSTALCFTVAVFAAFAIGVWTLPAPVVQIFVRDQTAAELMPLAAIWMLLNAALYVVLNQLRWNGLPQAYTAVTIAFTSAAAVISVVLIAVLHYGASGYIWGQLVGSAAALAIGLRLLGKGSRIGFRLNADELRTMLAFSIPLVISSLSVYATVYIDRWLLLAWRGSEELGVYAVGFRIASVVGLVTAGVQLALTPLIYTHARNPQTPAALRQFFRLFLLGTLGVIAVIASFAKEIVGLLAGDAYIGAATVVGWLAAGQVLANLYIFAPGLILAKKTGRIAMLNGVAAALNVTINAVLIPRLGILGAASGAFIASAVLAALYFRWGEAHYRIGYEWGCCGFAGLVVLAILSILQVAAPAAAWRVLICVLACTILALLLLRKDDLRSACQWALSSRVHR